MNTQIAACIADMIEIVTFLCVVFTAIWRVLDPLILFFQVYYILTIQHISNQVRIKVLFYNVASEFLYLFLQIMIEVLPQPNSTHITAFPHTFGLTLSTALSRIQKMKICVLEFVFCQIQTQIKIQDRVIFITSRSLPVTLEILPNHAITFCIILARRQSNF